MKEVRFVDFLLLFVELDNESLLDEMSKSGLDSTSLLLFDLLEDAVLLDLSCTLCCLLFLECLVFGEDASLLDKMSESELDSSSLSIINLLEEAVFLDWSCTLFCLLFLIFLVLVSFVCSSWQI